MNILFTSIRLNDHGGAQAHVRELAAGLQRSGHRIAVYTTDDSNNWVPQNDDLTVIRDLEHLPFAPDVIHAQSFLDSMIALTALPDVPVVHHCHGAVWTEGVPRHPRIYRHLAMSRTLAERIMVEYNIPPEEITVMLNSVNLARFQKVRKLPEQAGRVLFFHTRQRKCSHVVAAIREAVGNCGLELDFAGVPFGPAVNHPEEVLPEYDLVFAMGRTAIEALACGCAVVVLGRTSCGELVRPDNFERLRQVNFSIAVNSPPPSVPRIAAELRRYSASDCAVVSARVRKDADMSRILQEMENIYEEAIQRHRNTPPDPRAESLATARYLRRLVPLMRLTDQRLRGEWPAAPDSHALEDLSARLYTVEKALKG